ncbi:MAG: sugar ABC transporter permease [Deinococcus sp.]|nr:sugar ABC transporter permease [Deinococcus sp.]
MVRHLPVLAPPAAGGFRLSRRGNRALWLAMLLVPPALFFTVFVAYPIASALVYSFYGWVGVRRTTFVGLANFQRLLGQQPFQGWTINAFWHNVIVFVILLIIQDGLALLLAILLARNPRGTRFYQAVFFLPVTLSLVIVGFQWKLFLNPIFGIVNKLLRVAGLGALAQPWLGQAETALLALILVNAWRWLGFPTMVFLAGIRAIPEEYFEAARLDGANEWQVVRHVTWPLLAPAVTIIVILTFIGSFNWFELPYVMAGVDGPPNRSTDVLGLYFYRTAFGEISAGLQEFGLGSALAVLMFSVILTVSIVWTRILRRREVELA